jgi:TolB-like protein
VSFLAELKRRNVFKVGGGYLLLTWVVIQVSDAAVPALHLPEWVNSLVFFIGMIGFPFALFFAWAFELTPEGLKKESEIDPKNSITSKTGQQINSLIVVGLVLALGFIVYQQYFSSPIIKSENDLSENQALEQKISPALGEKSIAVLPFENRSPNKNDAYFTDGIHDDLLTQLAKLNAFKVISRTSVMEYRNTSKNLKQIGEELGVASIMEGAVQRAGKRIRINVQLIDARTDEHLWAEIYDRTLTTDNLFDIQSEISKAIAIALKSQLAPEILATVKHAPTQNLNAYDLYLQGKKFSEDITVKNLKTSILLYQSSLKEDPQFKQAWTGLAYSQITLYWFSEGNVDLIKQARESLDAAKKIDPEFPELYIAEGNYYYSGFLDYKKAIKWYNKAIAAMPNYADAYMNKGWASRRAGLWQQAISNMQQSIDLNPRNEFNLVELAGTFQYLHRFGQAQEVLQKAKAINHLDIWYKSGAINQSLLTTGDIKQAQAITSDLQFVDQNEVANSYITTQIFARNFDKARTVVNQQMKSFEVWRWQINLQQDYLAQINFFEGDISKAKTQAKIALKRLNSIREKLGDDYRLITPEARMNAILENTVKVKKLLKKALEVRPKDAVTEITDNYQHARIYAIAGLVDEAIESLEPQLSPPSFTTVPYVNLDPAFDGIRNTKQFQAMLARHGKQK